MKKEFYFDGAAGVKIHGYCWIPDGEVRGVVQIVHGIAEHLRRYDAFASFLNAGGFVVVGEEHMGHGETANEMPLGYFQGGWFSAVEDTYQLLQNTRKHYPDLPYVLFGHSMGSFMSRTLLARYPDSGITACVLSGSGWQPFVMIQAGKALSNVICRINGAEKPSKELEKIIFAGYNSHVEHKRTAFDWLTRDDKIVDAYIADPLCGFTASAGLYRDLLSGIEFDQNPENLKHMNKNLPVLFVSGEEDPVGGYGRGVRKAADEFRKYGMKNVTVQLHPLCRHEILNEWNCNQIIEEIYNWIQENI